MRGKRATIYMTEETELTTGSGGNRSARVNGIVSRYNNWIQKNCPLLMLSEWEVIRECNKILSESDDIPTQVYKNLVDAPEDYDALLEDIKNMSFIQRCAVAEIALKLQGVADIEEMLIELGVEYYDD